MTNDILDDIIKDDLWTSEPFTKGQALIDLALMQDGVSVRELANRWKWSRSKVSNFLSTIGAKIEKGHQKSHCVGVCNMMNNNDLFDNLDTVQNKKKAAKKATLSSSSEKKATKKATLWNLSFNVESDTCEGILDDNFQKKATKKATVWEYNNISFKSLKSSKSKRYINNKKTNARNERFVAQGVTWETCDFKNWPSVPDEELFTEWLASKKRKKGSTSQRVMDSIGVKLTQAIAKGYTLEYCLTEAIDRGWTGFQVEWLPKDGCNNQAGRAKGKTLEFED